MSGYGDSPAPGDPVDRRGVLRSRLRRDHATAPSRGVLSPDYVPPRNGRADDPLCPSPLPQEEP